ncbi:hypothetical protein CLOM621_09044 [Clostridium sp. M62/1]|nr:hypothetical protein CLOM621_09044 [Clostridium sp. M62/1]
MLSLPLPCCEQTSAAASASAAAAMQGAAIKNHKDGKINKKEE